MKKIKIKGIEDSNHYYLLESKELEKKEIGDLASFFVEEDEIVRIIKEADAHFTANQFIVMKVGQNNSSVEYLLFDEDSRFDYI
ncbi:hypothetical protein [Chryseobacterium salviniae]|uniref:Uncharacterized protein n=1 Tax=Chryseobacterium salviniae TaxID=3101750 RepID=A0ABU6HUJ0_9FLAO|nr:hypothetical protein [Chryseobacterium sp. T9W2-O]MEC3876690.1 hypothetical protein [Chryseobacterium sp. T9W2-O]